MGGAPVIKVDNNKIVRQLSKKDYLGNKKRNLLCILAIVLTTFLVTTVCSLGGSYWKTVLRRSVAMKGILYDVALPEPSQHQQTLAYKSEMIKDAGLSVNCAIIEEYDEKLIEINLFMADDIHWHKQCLPAFESMEGAYPIREDEIVLSTRSLRAMGIDQPMLGMELPVMWKAAGHKDGDATAMTFRLSGYYTDLTSSHQGYVSEKFCGRTGVKQTDYNLGFLYITLYNSVYSPEDVEQLNEALELTGDQMMFADLSLLEGLIKTFAALGMLLGVIFISGYLFIRNVLYISITNEVKHFGQMKTLGMTDLQLRKYVLWQVFWNLCAGLPVGLLLGALVSVEAVPALLNNMSVGSTVKQTMIFHPLILVGAAVFSSAAVLMGSRQPMKLAGKMSAVEAMRYIDVSGGQKRRKGRNGGKPGRMAWWNVFRNKKQALMVLLSLFLAMTAFLAVSSVIYSSDTRHILDKSYKYDFRLLDTTHAFDQNTQLISESLVQELSAVEGIRDTYVVYSHQISFDFEDEQIHKYFKGLFGMQMFPDSKYASEMAAWKADPDYKMTAGWLVGIDENSFDRINDQLDEKLDKNAFFNNELILVAPLLYDTSAEMLVGHELSVRLTGDSPKKNKQIKIGAFINEIELPNYMSGGYGPVIYISRSLFETWVPKPSIELVDFNYEESFNSEMDQTLKGLVSHIKGLSVSTKMDTYNDYAQSSAQMRILGGGLCFILAFLAFLNFGNMMAVRIQNRRREFAILSGIGMTRGQIQKMLVLEGLYYGFISVGLTLLIGIPVSATIFKTTSQIIAPVFEIPVLVNGAVFAGMLIFCMVIPVLLFGMLQKGSIIEQLRS